jgi:hypothetical protein
VLPQEGKLTIELHRSRHEGFPNASTPPPDLMPAVSISSAHEMIRLEEIRRPSRQYQGIK